MTTYAPISAATRLTFDALEAKVRAVTTTFRGPFATVMKRDEAIDQLMQIEAQARAVRVQLRAGRVEERRISA